MPRLAEYDASWPERFAAEARAIADALGEVVVEVEHVGSTAVPGLAAKPTIDIAAGVTTLDLPAASVQRMEALGYENAEADSRPGEHRFRMGGAVPRDVIVHVVEWGGSAWGMHLAFRDALRRDPRLAEEYEGLKRSLLAERERWYRGVDKRSLIERVLAAAPAARFVLSGSAAETEAVAARLAGGLRRGDVVYVSGDLGAGKTTFVRGACRGLGVTVPVTSPTYTIGQRYDGVSHVDLYRFDRLTDADWGALEPYFEDAIVFVEWPERAGGHLPPPRVTVRLGHVDEERRSVALASEEADLLAGLL